MGIDSLFVAPCGMDCMLCKIHPDDRSCIGCTNISEGKSAHCRACTIKFCKVLKENKSGFCYECDDFPCPQLQQIDARYQANYKMSMIENLKFIRDNGMEAFREFEKKRWACKTCGMMICEHEGECSHCGTEQYATV